MTQMRSTWLMPRAGSLGRLRLREELLAPPAPGEARVAVEAVGLNFADVFACQGLYSATPAGAFVPGLECAGTVECLGDPVSPGTDLKPGDRVIALTRFGGCATALNARVEYLLRIPPGWTAAQAAAWPVQGLTAWYGLVELGAVDRGDVVLVQSAAGGVGLQALDLLECLGARTVAVVGREAKRDFLVGQRGVAPQTVILRDRRRFGRLLDAALRALGADGLDCVFDAVLGPSFRPAFARLRPEGRYVLYGAADFMSHRARPNYPRLAWRYLRRPRLDPLSMITANRSLMAFNLIWLWDRAERLPGALRELAQLTRRPPYVGTVLPFERAPEALRLLQSGQSIGKVVLSVAGDRFG